MLERPRIFGALIGLGYAVIYFFFAIFSAGAGHGTYIFFIPLWPYLLGGLFFPMLGYLGADLEPSFAKLGYLGLILLHYTLMVLFFFYTDLAEWTYVEKFWRQSSFGIILPLFVFVVGQIVIWMVFIIGLVIDSRKRKTVEI